MNKNKKTAEKYYGKEDKRAPRMRKKAVPSASYEERCGNEKYETNDPAWYAKDAALLRDSASIPFSYPLGSPLRWHGESVNIPGLCSIEVIPSIGLSEKGSDPINVAAMSLYSDLRRANSGRKNYDQPDLMLYLLAMSQVYSALTWAQRLYGYACLYDQRNRYLSAALLAANNVDADSMRDNLPSYRFKLNVLINKISTMAVPKFLPFFNRMAFTYSNLYIEGSGSIKEQLYQYVPHGFMKFSLRQRTGQPDDQTGQLTFDTTTEVMNRAALKWDEVIDIIDALITPIWEEEDFGVMSGDIMKYTTELIQLAPMPEFYPITPVYDAAVLLQMKNAKIATVLEQSIIGDRRKNEDGLGTWMDASYNFTVDTDQKLWSWGIYQDVYRNCLVSNPYAVELVDPYTVGPGVTHNYVCDNGFTFAGVNLGGAPNNLSPGVFNAYIAPFDAYCYGDQILTIPYADPTPEMVMEATRLVHSYVEGSTHPIIGRVASSGSELGDVQLGLLGFRVEIETACEVAINVTLTTLDPATGYPIFQSYHEYNHDWLIVGSNTGGADGATSTSFCTSRDELMALIKHFKFAPEMYTLLTVLDNNQTPISDPIPEVSYVDVADYYAQHPAIKQDFFELDNFTMLSAQNIRKLNEAALLNLLNVPTIGKTPSMNS